MDLRQLRYFVTVAEELHFGRAAERLGMTQPPLSQAVRALEQEIGVQLFARTKRTVALTPVGARWLPEVRALLAEAARLPALVRRLASGESGVLTLAFVSIADYSVLPDLVSRYTARCPEVQLHLREATSDVQIEALLKGEIDAGLIIPPQGAALPPSLTFVPLLREELILAAPKAWLDAGRLRHRAGRVRLADVADAPLIIFPRQSAPAFHDLITGYYAAQGLEPRLGQTAVQMQTIISLVSAGMGVALVPRSLRNLDRPGVRYLDFDSRPPAIETVLVWRRQGASPTVGRFVALSRPVPDDRAG